MENRQGVVRWGILGCGRIAGKFAEDLGRVVDGRLHAVASRDRHKAEAFAQAHGAAIALEGYESLAAHPEVDAIYVATPHAMHHDDTILCLTQGKPVLCEKAFAINSQQAARMIDLARERKVLLMEAMWTKFLPHYRLTMDRIRSGDLGEIRHLRADFGFIPADPVPQRLFDPALGGGTLLDIGIYNVFLALSVLGRPGDIEARMTPAPTGVDLECAITFHYNNGATAQLFSTFRSNLATEADIAGEKGRLHLTTRFYEPSATIQWYPGRPDTGMTLPVDGEPGWGYQHEIRHFQDCLRQGLTESPVMTHADTLEMMDVMDTIRRVAGIRYPVDA
jgi:predicted dehydrogenase